MIAAPVRAVSSPPQLLQRRIERALRGRTRYRYVQPQVLNEEQGWRIVSPCCSRRIDPDGGLIEIAWLQRLGPSDWRLHAREHEAARWRGVLDGRLDELLAHLAADPLHEFWI